MDLMKRSVDIIKDYQHEKGAFIAAPNFAPYGYVWLRDGTFVAYSLDRMGEHKAAETFYRWAHQTITRHSWKVERLAEKKARGEAIHHDDYLHTRYDLEGNEGKEPWGNFQLDGYGTYLWGAVSHGIIRGEPSFLQEISSSLLKVGDYLALHWSTPNFDCWEENEDKVHTSTLGCIYGGLKALQSWQAHPSREEVLGRIKDFIRQHCIHQGHLVKYPGTEAVDASLLWLSLPFGVYAPDDLVMVKTVGVIERDLTRSGVHRYPWDTYYGGGEWLLLTAWLSWYYTRRGNLKRGEELLQRVESLADEKGYLAEQVPEDLNDPSYYPVWLQRWGEIAKPLLWSHAMYLIAKDEMLKAKKETTQKG